MSDRESDNLELEFAIVGWRQRFGHTALLTCRQDCTGYDLVEIRAGRQIARLEQEAGGWCLYDCNGPEPVALAESSRHLSELTAAIGMFIHDQVR